MPGHQRIEEAGLEPAAPAAALLRPEQLSDLIGTIYDCVLDPARWYDVLGEICGALDFVSGMMGVVRPSGATLCQVAVGIEPRFLADIDKYTPDIVAMWGGMQRAMEYPLDEPIVHSRAIGLAAVQNNRYYVEWAKPQRLRDAVIIAIARDGSALGNFGFNRHESGLPIGDGEVAALRLLAPHIRRAVTISNLLEMKTIIGHSFVSVIDKLACGVVLADGELGIVHANSAATRMMEARTPITTERGRLVLPNAEAQAALTRAVHEAANGGTALGHKGIGIPAGEERANPAAVHVLPLTAGQRQTGARATVALFIVPGGDGPRIPAEALALLYDLTPAENAVLELVCKGSTVPEIGTALGVAPSTVRTHLLHLFQKTGAGGQSDLIRLASHAALPI